MKIKRGLDRTDRFIISEMIKNGRIKYTALAKKLNITPAAIKERVEKLVEKGFIKPSVLLNQSSFFPLSSIIGIEADADCVKILIRKLRNCPLIISITKTSGVHNLILHIVTKNLHQLESFLNNQIRSEPGIKHVEVNVGNTSVIPEFQQIRLYDYKEKEYVPCGLRADDKDVCLDCPGLAQV